MTVSFNTYDRHQVVTDFEQARRKVFWRDWFGRLLGKPNRLLSLYQALDDLPHGASHFRGLQSVPIDQIVGSEGRAHDFDRAFYPRRDYSRDRWIRIDQAYYDQVSLPPVELFKVGRHYFVRDGNHRISVARAQKQTFIDANVTEIELVEQSESLNALKSLPNPV